MPRASVCVLATLISGVSTALILASSPNYAEPRSLRGTVHDVKRGQSMHNGCRAGPCQIAYLNSVEDFCLWAPPLQLATPNTEHTLVAWCTNSAHRNRLIPDGTIAGAHMSIVERRALGVGKLTNINVPADGVASASGQGHKVRGTVFTSAYGQLEQIYDWTSFVSQEQFCFRACKPTAAASDACSQIHDISECLENVPGDYDTGVFEECNTTEMPSTLYQKVLVPPSHRFTQSFSTCTIRGTVGDVVAHPRRAIIPSLLTSSSQSHGYSTQVTSTTAGTAITVTSPFTTPAATTSVNSTTPVSSSVPTSASHSSSHTHTHSRSSFTSPSSSSHHSSSPSPSSLRASSSPISSMPSVALTSPSDPSSGTPASSVTPTTMLASSLALPPTPSFPSSHGMSSSFPGPPLPSTSYDHSTPSPVATLASFTSPSMSSSTLPSTPSQSSYARSSTPTTLSSSPSPTMLPTSSPSLASPVTSPSISSPTSSRSSSVLTFITPSSVAATSSASSSPVFQSSQTQIGSQCPPLVVANGGSVAPLNPLLPLTLSVLMIVLSSSFGIFAF